MKRDLIALAGLVLAIFMIACPGENQTQEASRTAERYWELLFKGEIRSAYNMLSEESKIAITYSDYSKKVGFGISNIKEIEEYWDVYYRNTNIEVKSAYVKGKTAVVSLTLTIPDPKWFPDEAYAEAQRLGLEGNDYALFMVRAQTQAMQKGEIPPVKIDESTMLVKEADEWRVVFTDRE